MDHEPKLVDIQKTVAALAEFVQNHDHDDDGPESNPAHTPTGDVFHAINRQPIDQSPPTFDDLSQSETPNPEEDAARKIPEEESPLQNGESDELGEVDDAISAGEAAAEKPADKVIIATGITKTRLRQLFQKGSSHPGFTKVPFLTSWSEEIVKRRYLQVYAQADRTVIVAPVQQISRGPVYKRLLDAGERRRSRIEKVKETYRQEQQRQEELNCTFRPTLSPPPHSRKHSESPATVTGVELSKGVENTKTSSQPQQEPTKAKPKTVFCRLHEEAVRRLQRQMTKSASMKKLTESQEMQGCTFHPAIWSQASPRSGRVSERLYEDAKRRDEYVSEIRAELDPVHDATFRPKVNARSRRLARQRSTGTVFERLYRAKLRDPSPIRGRPPWI